MREKGSSDGNTGLIYDSEFEVYTLCHEQSLSPRTMQFIDFFTYFKPMKKINEH